MKLRLTLGLMLALLCDSETLTVRIYDLARMPTGTIEQATATAGQILEKAGVKVNWEKGAANSTEGRLADWSLLHPPDHRDYLAIRLVRGPPTDSPEAELGYAMPFAPEGVHATIYYDRVEKLFFNGKAMPRIGNLVGATMAHEIGHILLRTAGHSAKGIMKANWGQEEFWLLSCKALHFAPEEAAGLRAGAVDRLAMGRKFAT